MSFGRLIGHCQLPLMYVAISERSCEESKKSISVSGCLLVSWTLGAKGQISRCLTLTLKNFGEKFGRKIYFQKNSLHLTQNRNHKWD